MLDDYKARFEQAMDDDFNTPVALSVLFDLARELNKIKEGGLEKVCALASTLRYLGGLLGVLQDKPEAFLKGRVSHEHANELVNVGSKDTRHLTEEQIEQQLQARIAAKKVKDWALADSIRNGLKEQGVILEDTPDGKTSWRRA